MRISVGILMLTAAMASVPLMAQSVPATAVTAEGASNPCAANSGLGDWSGKPSWNGWGASLTNARFQDANGAQLAPEHVSRLKLKWAFGFPGAKAVYGQPAVIAGRIFLGVDTGSVYSIDMVNGCAYWSYQAPVQFVRPSASVPARPPGESLTDRYQRNLV